MKNKPIVKYESKAWIGHVVLDPLTQKKKVVWDHPTYVQHEIDQFLVGDEIWTKMTNKKRKRTEAQNRYLHLYFTLISLSSGHSVSEIKSWAKGKFLSKGITEVFGDKVRVITETAKLTVLEMIEFIERIEAETGVPTPDTSPFLRPVTHHEWALLKIEQQQKYTSLKPKLKKLSPK